MNAAHGGKNKQRQCSFHCRKCAGVCAATAAPRPSKSRRNISDAMKQTDEICVFGKDVIEGFSHQLRVLGNQAGVPPDRGRCRMCPIAGKGSSGNGRKPRVHVQTGNAVDHSARPLDSIFVLAADQPQDLDGSSDIAQDEFRGHLQIDTRILQEYLQAKNRRRHYGHMVEKICILSLECLVFQKMETLPRRGWHPAMIVYRVERLIEHSSAPAAFLSANTEDLSKEKGTVFRLFPMTIAGISIQPRDGRSEPGKADVQPALKSKSTSLALHLTRAQRYSLHLPTAASSASR